MARDELREEMLRPRIDDRVTAAVAALIGATLLCVAIANAITYYLSWPAWVGYGVVAILLLAVAFGFMQHGRGQLKNVRGLPRTTQTMKDNAAWIQKIGRAHV